MYTKEEIQKMTTEEKHAAFLLDLDELLRGESKNYGVGLIATTETEEKVYEGGKVIAVNKRFLGGP